jgi:hypothetical protein
VQSPDLITTNGGRDQGAVDVSLSERRDKA